MASGNPYMRSFSSLIEAAISCSFRVSAPVDDPTRHSNSVARHRMVFEAIEDSNSFVASQAMTQVIAEGIENAHCELTSHPVSISMPLLVLA